MESLSRDDLRAAVAAGVLTEAQAARLLAIGEARLGQRAAMAPEDEPFELFRGFAEIFVSTGIILLMSGFLTLAEVFGGPVLPLVAAGLCWVFALYFTRKRRMALPSIVLAIGYAAGAGAFISYLILLVFGEIDGAHGLILLFALLMLAALVLYFRAFRCPSWRF